MSWMDGMGAKVAGKRSFIKFEVMKYGGRKGGHPVRLLLLLLWLCAGMPAAAQEGPVSFSKIGQAADSARAELFRQAIRDDLPQPVGYVNDYEDLFTFREEKELDSLLHDLERRTTIEVAIITIPDYLATAAGMDSFTLKLANQWGVGKKGADNGIVIGISKVWRQMRIQTGKGLAEALPDRDVQVLIDEAFLPYYKRGEYYQGTLVGLNALMGKLE